MSRPTPIRSFRMMLLATLIGITLVSSGRAQMTPEQQATMLLAGAKRAYNEKNYPFAADRFREFLAKYGGNKDVPAARYGLALCLMDGPTKDHDKALEQLTQLAGHFSFMPPGLGMTSGLRLAWIGVRWRYFSSIVSPAMNIATPPASARPSKTSQKVPAPSECEVPMVMKGPTTGAKRGANWLPLVESALTTVAATSAEMM